MKRRNIFNCFRRNETPPQSPGGVCQKNHVTDGQTNNSSTKEINKVSVDAQNMDQDDDFKPPVPRGRRTAVAAESYDPTADDGDDCAYVNHPKTQEQLACLEDAAKGIIFFKKCDKDQQKILFNAMFELKVKNGDEIIRQGDDGDNFYVVEKGEYNVMINDGDSRKKVATIRDKGFFGELALLYNCPRNATIVATGDGVLWGLDQKTFRQIVVKATARKRRTLEELLRGVSMLESLTSHELMNLTDALDEVCFSEGDAIIKQGEQASSMYFIIEGGVSVKVTDEETNYEKEIVKLSRGRYFGELALVLNKPRIASVYSSENDTKCAVLDINAFERLLGPCVEIMKRNIDQYEAERKKLGINSISKDGT